MFDMDLDGFIDHWLANEPTATDIDEANRYWEVSQSFNLEKYRRQEQVLQYCFNANVELPLEPLTLMRVVLLNRFYSTTVYAIQDLATHVCEIERETPSFRQMGRRVELVNRIRYWNHNGDERDVYCFATKYCSFRCPEVFPIYDSLSARALMFFNIRYHYVDCTLHSLTGGRSYSEFCNVYDITISLLTISYGSLGRKLKA